MNNELMLYDKIFDCAQMKMKSASLEFSFEKDVLLGMIGKNPQIIKYSEFENLNDWDMFCTLYLRCLNRLPDPMSIHTLERYQKLCMGKSDILLSCLIRFMKKSNEFKQLNKVISIDQGMSIQFLQAYQKYGMSIVKVYVFDLSMRVYGVIHRNIIQPIWIRLPLKIKNRIRKCFHREEKRC